MISNHFVLENENKDLCSVLVLDWRHKKKLNKLEWHQETARNLSVKIQSIVKAMQAMQRDKPKEFRIEFMLPGVRFV